jgi:predicted DNA-binding transcriptional regulator YafY
MSRTPTKTSRFERITDLMLTLLDATQPVTMNELVAAVPGYPVGAPEETLRAAFERDKRILRGSGVEVVAHGPDGKLSSSYRLRLTPEEPLAADLTGDERAALALALAIGRIEGPTGKSALAKLASDVDLFGDAGGHAAWTLQLARSAVAQRRPLHFTYRGRTVDIEPYGVVECAGEWVVVGRDQHLDGCRVRSYHLRHIAEVPVIGRPDAYQLPTVFDPSVAFTPVSDADLADDDALAAVANRAIDAGERMLRLRSMLDYLRRFGTVPTVQLARLFQMRKADLVQELETVACCGAAPLTPDRLLEIIVDEAEVIGFGLERFERSSDLTADEAWTAAAAAYEFLAIVDDAPEALRAALAKLEALLGEGEIGALPADENRPWPSEWSMLVALRVNELSPLIERVMVGEPTELGDGGLAVLTFLADRRWRTPLLDTLGASAELEPELVPAKAGAERRHD